MFKAIDQETGAEIIAVDPVWSARLPHLRTLGRSGRLVCQGCRQPVLLRAGALRCAHFAHWELAECRHGHDSSLLLQARRLLYERLAALFGAQATIEKYLEDSSLPRPIDCWVQRDDRAYAYWIFDRRIQLQQRLELRLALEATGARINFVFLSTLRRQEEGKPETALLLPMEREFARHSSLDEVWARKSRPDDRLLYSSAMGSHWSQSGKSLNYINVEDETLTTLRDLRVKHQPSLHTAAVVNHALSEITFAPKTGEFVHPGEQEAWKEMKHRLREQAQLEAERKERALQALQEQARSAQGLKAEAMRLALTRPAPEPHAPMVSGSNRAAPSPATPARPQPVSLSNQSGTCEIRGSWTSDWYSFNGKTKTCRCNACLRSGRVP